MEVSGPMPTEGGCSQDRLLRTLLSGRLVCKRMEIPNLSGPCPSV